MVNLNKLFLISIILLGFVLVNISGVNAEETYADLMRQADELLEKARDSYDIGDYDTSAMYAEDARKLAMRADELWRLESMRKKAEKKLDEARAFVKNAEDMGAEKYAPDPLNEAKGLLGEAETFYTNKGYEESIEKSEATIAKARECIRIIEEKKKQEANKPKHKTYKVRDIPKRRDCLWRIAEYDFIYNDPFRWPIIYTANKKDIIDPDLIFPGQVFIIPSVEETSE